MKTHPTKIASNLWVEAYYSKEWKVWCGRYLNDTGHQLGDIWHGQTRDDVLVNRPER